MSCRSKTVIIGCGNVDRGDDAAGIIVARELQAQGIPALEHTADGLALIETWADADEVVLIDAMRSGKATGSVTEWDAVSESFPRSLVTSTHGFGVAEAVELARKLGRLPSRLYVYGIEGANFDPFAAMSPAVRNAISDVVGRVAARVSGGRSC